MRGKPGNEVLNTTVTISSLYVLLQHIYYCQGLRKCYTVLCLCTLLCMHSTVFQRKTLYINCVDNRIFPKNWDQMHYWPPIRSLGGHGPNGPPWRTPWGCVLFIIILKTILIYTRIRSILCFDIWKVIFNITKYGTALCKDWERTSNRCIKDNVVVRSTVHWVQ